MRTSWIAILGTMAMVLAWPNAAHAAHHLWRLQQLYSNADGSVQFVELETTSTGRGGDETQVSGFTVTSGTHAFTFNANLPAQATTQWLLLATSNIVTAPGGVAPDFVIPADFFSTGGGTITYANGADTWNYGTVPTDGVQALMRDPDTATTAVGTNMPVNFAGTAGHLTGAAPTTPALPGWALVLGVGAMLFVGTRLRRTPFVKAA